MGMWLERMENCNIDVVYIRLFEDTERKAVMEAFLRGTLETARRVWSSVR